MNIARSCLNWHKQFFSHLNSFHATTWVKIKHLVVTENWILAKVCTTIIKEKKMWMPSLHILLLLLVMAWSEMLFPSKQRYYFLKNYKENINMSLVLASWIHNQSSFKRKIKRCDANFYRSILLAKQIAINFKIFIKNLMCCGWNRIYHLSKSIIATFPTFS